MRESSRTERGVSVTGHFGEGLVELVGDGLELLLLMHELICNDNLFRVVHEVGKLPEHKVLEKQISLTTQE